MTTFNEALEICKQKLVEYEPRLKVKGAKTYTKLALHLYEHYQNQSSPPKKTIQDKIDVVMGKLVAQKDGFWVSEPEPHHDTPVGLEHGSSQGTVRHITASGITINLTLSLAHDSENDKFHLRVHCWYYPG